MCLSRSTVRMLNLCIISLMVVITTVVMKSTGIPATEVVTGRKRHKGRRHLGLVTMREVIVGVMGMAQNGLERAGVEIVLYDTRG